MEIQNSPFMLNAILMDIDGTMTSTDGHKNGMEKTSLAHLEDILMAKNKIPREEANRRILACGDIAIHCLSEFLEPLNVLPEEYFNALRDNLKRHTTIPEDVVVFLRAMKECGIPVYTATTNSRFMTLVKLSIGGLADIHGCDYLAGYYAGCTFLDPKGKFSPSFYPNILRSSRFDPEYVMMIGDEPDRDMLPAMKAGIKYGVNIDRRQKESIIFRDGGISVNSLEVLIEMIMEGKQCYA